MKKLASILLIFTFLISGAGLAWATDNGQTVDQKVDKKIKREQIKEERNEFKIEYQKIKGLRQQLEQARKDYRAKRAQLKQAMQLAKQNKATDKIQKAKADITGIKDLLKDRKNKYQFGRQELQDLKAARQNKDFTRAKAIVELLANNINNRISLIHDINTLLDKAIADLS